MSGTCECSLIAFSISCSCLHTHWHFWKVNFSIDFPIKKKKHFRVYLRFYTYFGQFCHFSIFPCFYLPRLVFRAVLFIIPFIIIFLLGSLLFFSVFYALVSFLLFFFTSLATGLSIL